MYLAMPGQLIERDEQNRLAKVDVAGVPRNVNIGLREDADGLDEGMPMAVLAAAGDGLAVCEGDVEVRTGLVGAVELGDVLLVHAGVALARLA